MLKIIVIITTFYASTEAIKLFMDKISNIKILDINWKEIVDYPTDIFSIIISEL